jgi:6-phosphofructokinase 2
MVYTITLNPALDRTIWVKKIKADDSNRIDKEERFAGGKGIDVSKVLTILGVNNTAMGFVGGFTG